MLFNKDIEAMSRDELECLQIERLKITLSLIKNSKSRLKDKYKGIEAEDIKSLDILKKLPFTTKDDLRETYPFGHIAQEESKWYRMHMSSGTTGNPVINVMTKNDISNWSETMARCYASAGVKHDDKIQITPSFGLFNGGFGFHFGAEKIGAFIIPIGAGRSRLQLKFIKELKTTVLCAIASYPLRLIEVAKDTDFDFKNTSLRVAILGAEVWSDEIRHRIESEMKINTFDIIGMTETGGVGLGIDCEYKHGIHVWEDHYIAEIVDPIGTNVLEDGQEGELVLTTLTREGLPLIRYRTRDITSVVSKNKCECGRTHMRVDRLKGRTDDMLKVKGVNFYPSQIESILMKYNEVSPYFNIVLKKIKEKGDIIVVIERKNGLREVDVNKIKNELYDFLGFHINLQVVPEGTIDRPNGKMIKVIDKRIR